MSFTTIMTEIISILVSGITGVATGIGGGLTSLVQAIFLDTSGTTTQLSVFGGLIVIFAGISLAIGLCRWCVNFLTSLGARNR